MRPIVTQDTNFTFKLPGGTEENDLPCVMGDAEVRSTWSFEGNEADLYGSEQPMFLHVYSHDTQLQVVDRDTGRELALEVVQHDRDGVLYIVGASGDTRREIIARGSLDLVIRQNPIPPVALWVQEWPANPEAQKQRWMVVVESVDGVDDDTMKTRLESLARHATRLGCNVTDYSKVGDLGDPEGLDSPGTKGA